MGFKDVSQPGKGLILLQQKGKNISGSSRFENPKFHGGNNNFMVKIKLDSKEPPIRGTNGKFVTEKATVEDMNSGKAEWDVRRATTKARSKIDLPNVIRNFFLHVIDFAYEKRVKRLAKKKITKSAFQAEN